VTGLEEEDKYEMDKRGKEYDIGEVATKGRMRGGTPGRR
jgi:hypothetical protein